MDLVSSACMCFGVHWICCHIFRWVHVHQSLERHDAVCHVCATRKNVLVVVKKRCLRRPFLQWPMVPLRIMHTKYFLGLETHDAVVRAFGVCVVVCALGHFSIDWSQNTLKMLMMILAPSLLAPSSCNNSWEPQFSDAWNTGNKGPKRNRTRASGPPCRFNCACALWS